VVRTWDLILIRVLHKDLFPQDRARTCINDAPLETARNRSAPMACGPNVDQASAPELCRGGGYFCRGGGYSTEIPIACQKTASAMIRVPYRRALRALLERLSGSATTNRSRVLVT
jgi:hypothetical protein